MSTNMTPPATRPYFTGLALLSLLLLAGWFAYTPAISGGFFYDDRLHLADLETAQNSASASQYILSGSAGPLGRPLALASFVLQGDTVDSGAEPFLRVNVLLHLFNALVLGCFLAKLALAAGLERNRALFAALSATAIWLFMPLLASSTLIVIQRMTTLSATFVLLTLTGYLFARDRLEYRPRRALVEMSLWLSGGTLLAVLSKENGALLPTFILVLEATVLSRPRAVSGRVWRAWSVVFLFVPTAAILAYLASRVPYAEAMVLRRDFNAGERLLTEATILWQYLKLAFIPQAGAYGPFHDGYPIARSLGVTTLLSLVSWLAIATAAFMRRRRYPLLSFAALWFLGGHLIESTVLPLELYFEHRNYLPIIGPVFALCAFAASLPTSKIRYAYVGVSVYAVLQLTVLVSLTSLWGQPATAAHYWKERFPESIRANTTAATSTLMEGWPKRAIAELRQFGKDRPDAAYVRIQELNLSCIFLPEEDHGAVADAADAQLRSVDFTYTAGSMLSQLITTLSDTECRGVDYDTVRRLAGTLHSNPRYQNDPLYNQIHHQLLARMARLEGDLREAVRHIERAIEYYPMAGLNMMMITTLVEDGRFDAARTHIQDARRVAPWQPMKRQVWLSQLDNLENLVVEVESAQSHSPDSSN